MFQGWCGVFSMGDATLQLRCFAGSLLRSEIGWDGGAAASRACEGHSGVDGNLSRLVAVSDGARVFSCLHSGLLDWFMRALAQARGYVSPFPEAGDHPDAELHERVQKTQDKAETRSRWGRRELPPP
jgi:hypothetical protein